VANKSRKRGGRKSSGGPGRTFYIVLALVVAAGVVALFALRGGGGEQPVSQPMSVAALNQPADSSAGIVEGSADAPVTIAEFGDYTCPHCAEFTRVTGRALRQNYVETGKVKWIFYDFPLNQSTNAIPAALAARCAGEQGRYWPMHDLLYANQLQWVRSNDPQGRFEDYAGQAGVGDMDRWKQCYESQKYVPRIMASRAYGDQLGVNATPTIFLNGREVPLRQADYGSLERLIQQATPGGSSTGSP